MPDDARAHEPSRRHAGAALAGMVLALAAAWFFDFLVDDAFITFRYARHLAEGHGLVWNLGETPPVEGFSNFLWVVACALMELVRIPPEVGARVVSCACAVYLTFLVARAVAPRADAGVASRSALAFAALPPIGMWATGGLEAMPFALALFGAFEALTRRDEPPATRAALLWTAAAVLLRADGFVWVAIVLSAAWVSRAVDSREERRSVAPLVQAAAVAAFVTLAYVAWRYAYFEQLGPNTARVKVHIGALSLERGAKYVASAALAYLSLPLALVGGAWALRRDRTGLAAPALVAFAGASAYLALVGGDWMMGHRMLVPALPFVALALAAFLARVSVPARPVAALAAIALGVLPSFDVLLVPRRVRELTHFRWGQEHRTEVEMWRKGVVDIEEWIAIGRALALFTQPGESMVLGNIGAFGYYPENLVVYDTHGLTNHAPLAPVDPAAREMPGHDRKVDMGAFAALEPTYLNARIVARDDPWALIPQNWRDPGSSGPNEAARARFEFLLHPLDPAQGFEPDTALLLIKHRR